MSNIGTKTYKAKIGLSDIERQKFNDDAVNEANRVANEYIEENTERTETALAGIEDFGGRLATAEEKVDRKLDKDGYSALAHVGLADNLASPDGVIDTEPFTFRPTAGTTSVSDGYAEIKEIKGNTIVLNQLFEAWLPSETKNGITLTNNNDGSFTLNGTATTITTFLSSLNFIKGHKYLMVGCPQGGSWGNGSDTYMLDSGSGIGRDYGQGVIGTANNGGEQYIGVYIAEGVSLNNILIRIRLYDLTKMFGAGKEPATVADFNNLTRNMDTDTYNEGQFINSLPINLVSTGFNAFDGELEQGGLNANTGLAFNSDVDIRSVDFIEVVAGQDYTLSETFKNITKTVVRYVFEYDKYKNFIKRTVFGNSSNSTFISNLLSDKTCYVRVGYSSSSQIKIANLSNISFHLTHSGYRNGQYEPHWSEERHIDTTKYFPEGMKSAGTAADLLTPKKATRNIGDIPDLSKMTWYVYKTGVFYTYDANFKPKVNTLNSICPKYPNAGVSLEIMANKTHTIFGGSGKSIWIRDDDCGDDTTALTNSLTNVPFYYELAEPEETELEQTRANDWFYRISDFGTEEQLVVDGFAPAVIETFYMNNLRDKLRNLPEIPKCEDTTGISVLKCINGTLTWVKETATTEE